MTEFAPIEGSIETTKDIDLLVEKIKNLLHSNNYPRATIRIQLNKDHCEDCGKPLEIGNEKENFGRTVCIDCETNIPPHKR